jgi:hypothetical protein
VIQSWARLASLPPVELGIFQDGSAWIVDGNHRLIDVVFTFVGT